jgi:anti-sigma B factor antagonist
MTAHPLLGTLYSDHGPLTTNHRPQSALSECPAMPLNVRFDGDVAVLSNFARLMNDPRYVDASRDIGDLLERGARSFVIDLTGVRETGASFLGLLMTLTRRIRQQKGEVVLAHVSREMETFLLGEMQMQEYWDILQSVEEAIEFFRRGQR